MDIMTKNVSYQIRQKTFNFNSTLEKHGLKAHTTMKLRIHNLNKCHVKSNLRVTTESK